MSITKDHREGYVMTATEELRRLLDERGVEWGNIRNDGSESDYLTEWQFENNQGKAIAIEWTVGSGLSVEIHRYHLTPEQAIAATLGRGECRLHDCEGSFAAVNRPVWRCDCGAFVTQYTDATTYHKPRFCPNCGRRIVGPTTNDVDAEVSDG